MPKKTSPNGCLNGDWAFKIWSEMEEPEWAHLEYLNQIFKPSAITQHLKRKRNLNLWEVDPELRKTMESLGLV